MCEPATLATASLVASVAGTGVGLIQQSQAASAQEKHQNNLMIQREQEMEVNQILANRAATNEQEQINEQISEKQIETSQTLFENTLKAAEAKAAAKVASGEAGVAGLSIDAIAGDFSRREARFADSVRQNEEGFRSAAQARKEAVEAKRQGRAASVNPYIPKPIQGPDYASALVGIVGAGIDYYRPKE